MTMLEGELTTLAICWRLERGDGVSLGFTTHDRDLAIGGLIFRSEPGMLPSSISLSDGFDAGGLDVRGALSSVAIRAEDLAAGRWDGAAVTIFMTDWTDPDSETLMLARGTLGDIDVRGEAFEAELKGPAAALDRPVVEQTSPECRAELGDSRCRADMAGRVRTARVTAIVDAITIDVSEAADGNAYGYGRLRWIGGANSGLSGAILKSAGTRITLREPPRAPPEAGDLIELREGCDKALATCAGRFANAANFRGEPHLPGMDLLTRYPGA